MAWAAAGASMLGNLPSPSSLFMGQWAAGQDTDRQKSMIRHLRRREYKDMMFSMKEAGLNPMLASGATPGHFSGATAMGGPGRPLAPNAGQAFTSGSQAATAAKVGGTTAALQSAKAAHELDQRLNTIFQRAGVLQQFDLNRMNMRKTEAETRTQEALAAVYGKQAGLHSAHTLWLDQQRETLAKYGPPGHWQDAFMKGIGQYLTGDGKSIMKDLFMPPTNPFTAPAPNPKSSARPSSYEKAAEAAVKYPYSNMLQVP